MIFVLLKNTYVNGGLYRSVSDLVALVITVSSSIMFVRNSSVSFLFLLLSYGSCWDEEYDRDSDMQIGDLIKKMGFPGFRSYNITTPDGYILNVFRIGQKGAKKLYPIIFVHGVTACAQTFFITKETSAPIVFAKLGYDVWLLNSRGTDASMGHVSMNKTDKNYWNFSFHEIGTIDLRTLIDFVLEKNDHNKTVLIGHSAGTTEIMVLLSAVPEYNDKVAVSFHWGVSVYHENCVNIKFLRALCYNLPLMKNIAKEFDLHQLMLSSKYREAIRNLCRYKLFHDACEIAAQMLLTPIPSQVEGSDWSFALQMAMCGGSVKEIFHFMQIGITGRFARYDFGPEDNMKVYNTTEPPLYNLTNVRSPVVPWCGHTDVYCTQKDVDKLVAQLPHVESVDFVGKPLMGHYDYLIDRNLSNLLFKDMIVIIEKYTT